MKAHISFVNRLSMPVMISNREGKIVFRNDGVMQDKALRLRRSLRNFLPKETFARYRTLGDRHNPEVFSFCIGASSFCALVLAGEGVSVWYFPVTLRQNRHLPEQELSVRGIPEIFAETERKAVLSESLDAGETFGFAAGQMLSRLYPDGEVPVRNFIGCILLSSRLLFGDDRIVCAEKGGHAELWLEEPLVSYRAAGKVIGCLAADHAGVAKLVLQKERMEFRFGETVIDAGGIRQLAGVRVIAPYSYAKTDAAVAIAASCASELTFLRNNIG